MSILPSQSDLVILEDSKAKIDTDIKDTIPPANKTNPEIASVADSFSKLSLPINK